MWPAVWNLVYNHDFHERIVHLPYNLSCRCSLPEFGSILHMKFGKEFHLSYSNDFCRAHVISCKYHDTILQYERYFFALCLKRSIQLFSQGTTTWPSWWCEGLTKEWSTMGSRRLWQSSDPGSGLSRGGHLWGSWFTSVQSAVDTRVLTIRSHLLHPYQSFVWVNSHPSHSRE